jgi:zinc protease
MIVRRSRRVAIVVATAFALGAGAANSQLRDWPSERPPRPLPARDVKFPPYSMRTLANGLQVVAVSHHEQPAVSLRLLIRAGGAQDPGDKPGVAALAAALLDQGTTTRSAEQIAQTIDSIGGAIGSGSGSDLTFINAVVMKDSFNIALDLISDSARNPGFAPREIELQRKQMLSGLQVSYDDPEYLAGAVFDRLVYGSHPYGRPDGGTPESIASITRDDLLAFHKAWFGANNAILAIVGDVTREEAFAGAERAFGSWDASARTPEKLSDLAPPQRLLVIVDRPGTELTEIRVGNLALPRKHTDYLALDLAIKILGGEGGNRLHRVLRSDRGLTYGASADLNALKDAGSIVADTNTPAQSTGETLRLLVDEIWRLQRERVSERELSDAQAYLSGSFPLTIETPSAIALQVLNAVFYGLDLQELQTFRERVNAVTVDDIQRVAKTYLHPDRLSIALVGDASRFQKQLAGLGFDRVERIPVGELDLTSADLRIKTPAGKIPAAFQNSSLWLPPSAFAKASADRRSFSGGWSGGRLTPGADFRLKADATSQDRLRADVRSLIDRAVRAKGGVEKLRSIQTVHAVSDLIAETPNGKVTVPTTIRVRYPRQFRIDSTMPTGPLVQVFDSGSSWVRDSRGVNELSDAAAESMRQNVVRDHISLLLALHDGRVAAHRLPDELVDGRSMPVLSVDLKTSGPLILVFDAETALIARQRYPARGVKGEIEETLSDYRDISGLQVAFRVTIRHPGESPLTRVLRTFDYNVPLDNGVFTKPG